MTTLENIIDAVVAQLDAALSAETDLAIHVQRGFFRAAEMPSVNVYPGPPGGLQATELAAFGDTYGAWSLLVRAVVSPADLEAAESILWGLMDDVGALSLIAALDSDRELGGAATTVFWGEWSECRDFSPPDQEGRYVGAVLPVIVAKAHS